VSAETGSPLIPAAIDQRFSELNDATNAGDQRAAKDLLALCTEHPILYRRLGDLQVQAEHSWYAMMVPGETNRDVTTRTVLEKQSAQRRKDLLRDGSSALETILVDRIISAWLQVVYAEMKYTQALSDPSYTFARSEFCQKRLERANRQLIRAIQALATVRRLLRPTQVNIGQNQINVAR
jgi:hypothetical protein